MKGTRFCYCERYVDIVLKDCFILVKGGNEASSSAVTSGLSCRPVDCMFEIFMEVGVCE